MDSAKAHRELTRGVRVARCYLGERGADQEIEKHRNEIGVNKNRTSAHADDKRKVGANSQRGASDGGVDAERAQQAKTLC